MPMSSRVLLLFLLVPALGLSACSGTRRFDLADVEDPSSLTFVDFEHQRQTGRTDCGAAALAIVCSYWGRPTSPANVLSDVAGGRSTGPGIAAGDLKACAESYGLEAFLLRLSPEEIRGQISLGRPVIVSRKQWGGIWHYEVAVGYDEAQSRMILADPADAPYSIPFPAFEKRHSKTDRFALLVAPRATHEKGEIE
ncbi:C39 family peptidase [bacterium]|nr:C39 family peptidase [bacterium]